MAVSRQRSSSGHKSSNRTRSHFPERFWWAASHANPASTACSVSPSPPCRANASPRPAPARLAYGSWRVVRSSDRDAVPLSDISSGASSDSTSGVSAGDAVTASSDVCDRLGADGAGAGSIGAGSGGWSVSSKGFLPVCNDTLTIRSVGEPTCGDHTYRVTNKPICMSNATINQGIAVNRLLLGRRFLGGVVTPWIVHAFDGMCLASAAR